MKRLTAIVIATTAFLALASASASAAPPVVESVGFSKVTTDSVRLKAEVNPGSKATEYHFEYGLADCASNPCTSTPTGEIPAGASPVPVEADIEGLTPGTTYHFRVVANNVDGEDESADHTFKTFLPPFVGLPDGRAYEQASPVDKNALDAKGMVAWVKAASNGNAVSFLTTSGIPGSEGAQELPAYLSTRGADDWSTQGLLPNADLGAEAFVVGWTPDHSESFSWVSEHSAVGDTTFVARSSVDGSLTTIVPYGEGLEAVDYAGTSADRSAVFFEGTDEIASVPASLDGEPNLYVWDRSEDELALAGVFNDGSAPPAGAFAGAYDWIQGETAQTLREGGSARGNYLQDQHAISSDGSVYFTAAGTGQLYLRTNPTEPQSPTDGEGKCTDPAKACTIHVSASQRTTPDPLGARPAAFQVASADGSAALFTSGEELTNDANTGPDQEPPTIARADIDGKPASIDPDFIPATALGIAVDATHIYWADSSKDTIGRAEIDGENPDPDYITGADNPQYVTVEGEFVYWTNAGDEEPGTGSIGRAKIGLVEGEEVEQEFIPGILDEGEPTEEVLVTNPRGIDVDASFVYWVNAGRQGAGSHTVGRADIEGNELEPKFIDTGDFPGRGLVANSSHIYWTASFDNGASGIVDLIVRRNLAGDPSSQKRLEEDNGDAQGIALDANFLYWIRRAPETIARIKLADFDLEPTERKPELEWIKSDGLLKGIAVNPTHIFWSLNGETPPNPGNDLYRYDATSDTLSDLTPDATDENGAEVKGVLGASEDLSHVYFAANGDLDGGGPATKGTCQGRVIGGNIPGFFGECSLYLAREGMPTLFVAQLDASGGEGSDAFNWVPNGGFLNQRENTARVTPDGQTLLFRSQAQLTDYDNEGAPMLYRYRVGDTGPTCVSCNPTGGAAGGLVQPIFLTQLPIGIEPALTLSRSLSTDGNRAFFESTDALVAADTNGEDGCPLAGGTFSESKYPTCQDVYLWEAEGTGTCKEDMQGGGCLYLLSTGTSPEASFFADASLSGDDAFVITSSPGLVLQDQDQLYDVFDARVGGGLAAQNTPPVEGCQGLEACRPAPPAPPATPTPGSEGFSGPGNVKPSAKKPRCPKGKRAVRAKGKTRCVAKKRRKGHQRSKRAARTNRGVGR